MVKMDTRTHARTAKKNENPPPCRLSLMKEEGKQNTLEDVEFALRVRF